MLDVTSQPIIRGGHNHVALANHAVGKIIITIDTSAELHLFGQLDQRIANDNILACATSKNIFDQLFILAKDGWLGAHRQIQYPQGQFIIGGAALFVDPRGLFYATSSADFGPVSRLAIMKCFEQTSITHNQLFFGEGIDDAGSYLSERNVRKLIEAKFLSK